MKSVFNSKETELIINKSKFISILYFVNNEDEVKEILNEVRKKYSDSTHVCYSYIIGNVKRFNDDSEPGGTAGMPILSCLENNDLNHILCVVIRYFGGIKLGTGGLVRAYSKSCSLAIKNSDIKDLIDGFLVTIHFSYNDVKKIDNLLCKYNILNRYYNEDIVYEFNISVFDFDSLSPELSKLCNIERKNTLFFN